jgi:uncharacterized protein (DUF2147 family)
MLPIVATTALMLLFSAQAPASASIEGLWRNPIGSAIIRLAPCGRAYCGTVVWASARGKREASTSTSDIVGTTVLTSVKPAAANRWTGQLFIPDDNLHVTATLQLRGDRELKLTGCALLGLFCRSQIWTRTDEPLPAGD